MSGAKKILITGGLILAAIGMLYGLHYALFVEHQTLDRMGGALADSFVAAAERHVPECEAALAVYSRTKYQYVRQVDVHSHWIGLAMLLIVLGAAFDHVAFSEQARRWLAIVLLTGAVIFPLGVWLQTAMTGPLPSAMAIAGSALITVGLSLTIAGFVRNSSELG